MGMRPAYHKRGSHVLGELVESPWICFFTLHLNNYSETLKLFRSDIKTSRGRYQGPLAYHRQVFVNATTGEPPSKNMPNSTVLECLSFNKNISPPSLGFAKRWLEKVKTPKLVVYLWFTMKHYQKHTPDHQLHFGESRWRPPHSQFWWRKVPW